MTFLKAIIFAATVAMVSVDAASISTRGGFSWNSIKDFSLHGWGPLEKSTSEKLIMVDPDYTSADYIKKLKKKGKIVACYINFGAIEPSRSDKKAFTSGGSILAKKYKGFNERWMDITKWKSNNWQEAMGERFKRAAKSGCDAVELDNTDCDQNRCVDGYTEAELKKYQVASFKWAAKKAKNEGLAVGLKNSLTHLKDFLPYVDYGINESCQVFNECGKYKPLTDAGKPVFGVEYSSHNGNACSTAKKHKIILKYKNGGQWKNCF